MVIYGLLFVLTLQFDFTNRQLASERALNIAEAGVNYYRWHLAHDPVDYQDGTGGTGPYVHAFSDPQGTQIGHYSLEITPPSNGSSVVTISSTGWSDDLPNVKRTITAQYGIPSLGEYSFLSNGSVWYGAGSVVNGRVHSNNGVRMDGTNLSLVTSSQTDYQCGTETGCHPPENKPGVWGAGGDQALWQFPVSSIDFDSVSLDFADMKTAAQTDGLYLDGVGVQGYHLVFAADGTFKVYKVTATDWLKAYSVPGQGLGEQGIGGCRKEYQLISSEQLLGTYTVANTPILLAESTLWVEGVVDGRITVAAAHFPIQSSNVNIWIRDSITYKDHDGSDTLGLIAQADIYFVRDVPDDFMVDAVLMAQSGKIIRHGYLQTCGGTTGAVKNSLTLNGSVISYYKSYWNFGDPLESGFTNRYINYDSHNQYAPPPFFPTSGDYEFISWKEE